MTVKWLSRSGACIWETGPLSMIQWQANIEDALDMAPIQHNLMVTEQEVVSRNTVPGGCRESCHGEELHYHFRCEFEPDDVVGKSRHAVRRRSVRVGGEES
ncbi:hypothetical protein XELAEV_18001876mg [Xenopus laevis]|uniref:Uncharacterized protein n=1 Tax=Xenopus laevis TaxID=8355 RepID=A0A974GZ92_XENLA|nr:hypothetical protein XELAEV_18001876mg [Xenopus laevis]